MEKNNCITTSEEAEAEISDAEENISECKKDGNSKLSHAGIKFREIETLDLPGQEGPVKNTIHATKFGMKLFSEWCAQNNHSIDLENVSDDKLNDVLSDFFTNVRSQEGKQYSESSLINFKYSIQRYMSSLPEESRKDLKGSQFYRANNVLLKVIREIRASEAAKNPSEKATMVYLTREDILKIYQSGVFSTNEPNSLLHKVWFEVCLHFCRKNREVQRQMSPDLFEFAVDESGRRYVYYKKHLGSKNPSLNNDICLHDPKDCRMVEVKGHPMCPVRSLEKYLSKIKHLTKDGSEPCLFYRPRLSWDKQSKDAKWYSTLPVGKNALSAFMTSISNAAKLSHIYTAIVLKTLPVGKWREIVFESVNQRVSSDTVALELVGAIQSQNIIPLHPISLTNYLGNITVSQQQINMRPSLAPSQQLISVQGAGDATVTAQLNLSNTSRLPLTISQATTRPFLTASGGQVFIAGNDGRQALFDTGTLARPKPIYSAIASTPIKPLLSPDLNTSKTEANPLSGSKSTPESESKINSGCSHYGKQHGIQSNSTAIEGKVHKCIQKEKNGNSANMSYVEAKQAVKDIFDRLDYWALANLVNWMKRVDVLKDTSGKVVCNDPLCKPVVSTKTANKLDSTSDDTSEMGSCDSDTTRGRSSEDRSQQTSSRGIDATASEGLTGVVTSYQTLTPDNQAMKPGEDKKEKPYQHIPIIQQCYRKPGKSSRSLARRSTSAMGKLSTNDSNSSKIKPVSNTPQDISPDETKTKCASLLLNPQYRYRKQVFPLHIYPNTAPRGVTPRGSSSKSPICDTTVNRGASPPVLIKSERPSPCPAHLDAASPKSKRRKLHSEEPKMTEKKY